MLSDDFVIYKSGKESKFYVHLHTLFEMVYLFTRFRGMGLYIQHFESRAMQASHLENDETSRKIALAHVSN